MRRALLPLAALACYAAFFAPVVVGDLVLSPPYTDVYRISFPFIDFLDRAIAQGEWPLWTPHQFSGHPHAANGQASIYYLPKLLVCLVFDGPALLGAHAMVHAGLGWLAMFVLLRSRRASAVAAGLGAWAWIFCGFHLGTLAAPAFVGATAIWFPLATWLVARAVRAPTPGAVAALALCIGVQLTSGILTTLPIFVLYAGAYALVLTLRRPPGERAPAWVALGAAFVLGGLVAAVHLLPSAEMAVHSQRLAARTAGGASAWLDLWAVTRWSWAWPGALELSSLFAPLSNAPHHQREPLYLALPVLVLGSWQLARLVTRGRTAMPSAQQGDLGFFGAAAAVGLVLALENPIRAFLAGVLPALATLQIAAKAEVVFVLAMVVLATARLDALRDEAVPPMARLAVPLIALLAVGLAYAAIAVPGATPYPAELVQAHGQLLTASVVAFAALWIARDRGWLGAQGFAVGLAIHIVATTTTVAIWNLYAGQMTQPRAGWYAPRPDTDRLRRASRDGRVLAIGRNLYPNSETIYGLRGLNGYAPMHWRRYGELLHALEEDGDPYLRPGFLQHVFVDRPRPGAARLLGLGTVLTPQGRFEPADAAPRAWLSGRYEIEPDDPARLLRIRLGAFSREVVLLEADPGVALGGAAPDGTVVVTDESLNRMVLDVDTREPALLTLSELAYPGWRATRDGEPIPIWTSYHVLRTVAVPAGHHQVVFEYAPWSFRLGAALSGAGLLAVGVLAIDHARRRMRAGAA